MKNQLVACMQITWDRDNTPETQILAEIAQAGYEGAVAGPAAHRSAEETIAVFERFGLKPAPGYMGAEFWDPGQAESIVDRAAAMAEFMNQVGCTELYVAASGMNYITVGGKTRRDVAGHVGPADSMSKEQYRQFADVLNRVGEATLREGVKSCFHNHVGTVIETREEIDRLFSLVDRDVVFLGPDTGHLAWGGADVVEFFHDYAASIKTVHLKDINPDILREGREKEWPYNTFTANGIFAELGEGFIDFPAVFEILEQAGFSGWLIAETDVTMKPTALDSVTISRNYLKSLGI